MNPDAINLRARLEMAVAGPAPPIRPTVAWIVAAFMDWAASYYPQRRNRSSEVSNFRNAVALLLDLYGDDPADSFGPLGLQAVRQGMIELGLSRKYVNAQVRRIRSVWSWGLSRSLLPPERLTALKAVAGLRRGRSAAKDRLPVKPPSSGVVEATLPHLKPVHAAMVGLMLLTGMRPGEVCQLTGGDIQRDVNPWRHEPAAHKTAYLGRGRVIFFGPQAQLLLQPWLKPGLLFTGPRRNRAYTSKTFGKVIERAIRDHDLPHWHLNQLRHQWATMIRDAMGAEAASASLGHARIETTMIYSDKSVRLAREVASRFG